jgi:hypothetical protein
MLRKNCIFDWNSRVVGKTLFFKKTSFSKAAFFNDNILPWCFIPLFHSFCFIFVFVSSSWKLDWMVWMVWLLSECIQCLAEATKQKLYWTLQWWNDMQWIEIWFTNLSSRCHFIVFRGTWAQTRPTFGPENLHLQSTGLYKNLSSFFMTFTPNYSVSKSWASRTALNFLYPRNRPLVCIKTFSIKNWDFLIYLGLGP